MLADVSGIPAPSGAPLHLRIEEGDLVRVVGPNGSGKTSLLRALAGLESPLRPTLVKLDRPGFSMQHAIDSLIGLTVAGEFRLRRMPAAAEFAHFPEQDVATLSSGEARRLSFAVARHRPIWLIDEPMEGLDDEGRADLKAMISHHLRHGAVVIVDSEGNWSAEATQTVSLGDYSAVDLPDLPPPGEGPIHDIPRGGLAIQGVPIDWPEFQIGPGLHCVTGPNGCGKTTLLRHVAGLDDTDPLHKSWSMLPSDGRLLLTKDTVSEELADCNDAVVEILVPPEIRNRHPLTLSGGEAQRVSLAKVLGSEAQLLILDEPDAHLDEAGKQALWQVLSYLAQSGKCILAATHTSQFIEIAHSVIDMAEAE